MKRTKLIIINFLDYEVNVVYFPILAFTDLSLHSVLISFFCKVIAFMCKLEKRQTIVSLIQTLKTLCLLLQALLTTKGPCPRPEIMTERQLNKELERRGLSSMGSLHERRHRLSLDDRRMYQILELYSSMKISYISVITFNMSQDIWTPNNLRQLSKASKASF